jgi:hypothetical protein
VESGVGHALPQLARLDQRLDQKGMAQDAARQRIQCVEHAAQPLQLAQGRLPPRGVAEDLHHATCRWR